MTKHHFTYLTLFLCALNFAFLSSAQTGCYSGSRANVDVDFNTQKSGFNSDPNKEYYLPVYIYSFADGSGNYEPMSNIQTGLDILQEDFNPMNIFFEFGCINEVYDVTVPTLTILSSPMNNYLESNYVHSNAITIFVFGPNHAASVGGLNGGFFLEALSGERYLYLSGHYPFEPSVRTVTTHLPGHEMGHLLGLEHTFLSSSTSNTDPAMGTCRELVDGTNCEDCGDFVCATPASYGLSWSNLAGCVEPSTVTESGTGSTYVPMVKNIMEYSTSDCMMEFTMGNGNEHDYQESRMKYFLEYHPWLSAIEPVNQTITVSVCNSNFQPICGPDDDGGLDFSHKWYYDDPVTQTSILVSEGPKAGPCYTPTEYGRYHVIYTDQYGCSRSMTFNVVEGFGPEVQIEDIKYCEEEGSTHYGPPPSMVGLTGPYSDALSYSWTYDDLMGGGPSTISGATGYQTAYIGDGTYCVTINWSDVNIPSLLGCTSEACFDVEQCCEPNPEFQMDWSPAGTSSTLTITNFPSYTFSYDLEQFVLYEDCDGNGWVTSSYPTIVRTSNFNVPVVYSGLDELCDYKVVHRVSSNCLRQSFLYQESVSGALRIEVYPNPSSPDSKVVINMISKSSSSTITVYNMITGALSYTEVLRHKQPITIDRNTLTPGQYIVQVQNGNDIKHELLIIQ